MKQTTSVPIEASKPMNEFSFVDSFVPVPGHLSFLNDLQARALETYRSLPFPDETTSGWHKVSLQGLSSQSYHLPATSIACEPERVGVELATKYAKQMLCCRQIVSQQGRRVNVPAIQGTGLSFGLSSDPAVSFPEKIIQKIGQIVPVVSDKFTAFGYAFASTSTVFYLAEDQVLKAPVFYQEIQQGNHLAVPSTTLIYLARNSSATLMRQRISDDPSHDQFSAGVLEVHLEEGAHLDLLDLNGVSSQSWDFQNQKVILEKDAVLNEFTLLHSPGFSKYRMQADLAGKGSQANITGLFLPAGKQRFYMDTHQNHLGENTVSDLQYRGVMDGESQGHWEGMIYVAPKALRADGYQANHNLILSRSAKVDAIPGLEILTDDVRCSHGVTVTNIDPEQQFYLTSRGIPGKEGVELIVSGFIQKALDRVSLDSLRQMIAEEFISRINKTML